MEGLFTFYPLLTILLGLIWALIYLRLPEVRREMITLGLFAVILMPVMVFIGIDTKEIANQFAQISVFDLLFVFIVAGIAGTIFHAIFGKHYHRLPTKLNKNTTAPTQLWLLRLFIIFLLFVWMIIISTILLKIPSSYSVLLASIVIAMYVVSHRHDLLADAIWSGFLTSFAVLLSGIMASIVSGADLDFTFVSSSLMIGPVPLDILLWSLAIGFAAGPLYEYVRTFELN